MKKLLTLLFAVLFVVALSALSFAQGQAPVVAPQGAEAIVVEGDAAVMMPGAPCCGPVLPGCFAPRRPFFNRGFCAPGCCDPCCTPCPAPCPTVCDPCCDPCGYPAFGYRTPIRNFFGRVFAARYCGYGCGPYYGYGCGPCGF